MKLLPNYFKLIGFILYTIASVLATNYSFNLDDVHKPAGLFIQLITLLSLVLIIFSKQKIDDEMVKYNRLKSLQISILVVVLLRVLYKCFAFYFEDDKWLPEFQINFLLLVYVIVFHFLQIVLPFVSQKIAKLKGHEE